MTNKNCDICGIQINGHGNNPAPFTGDVVCDKCNENIVVPLRVYEIVKEPSSALLFKVNGAVAVLKPKDKYFTIKELQTAVGGLIEVYPRKLNGHMIVCNEEGLLMDLPINELFEKYSGITLVGDILLCPLIIFEEPWSDEDE